MKVHLINFSLIIFLLSLILPYQNCSQKYGAETINITSEEEEEPREPPAPDRDNSKSLELYILDGAIKRKTPDPFLEREQVELSVSKKGDFSENLQYTWYFSEDETSSDVVLETTTEPRLQVQLHRLNQGQYWVETEEITSNILNLDVEENEIFSLPEFISFRVNAPSRSVIQKSGVFFVEQGVSYRFSISYRGNPMESITLFKDNELLETQDLSETPENLQTRQANFTPPNFQSSSFHTILKNYLGQVKSRTLQLQKFSYHEKYYTYRDPTGPGIKCYCLNSPDASGNRIHCTYSAVTTQTVSAPLHCESFHLGDSYSYYDSVFEYRSDNGSVAYCFGYSRFSNYIGCRKSRCQGIGYRVACRE